MITTSGRLPDGRTIRAIAEEAALKLQALRADVGRVERDAARDYLAGARSGLSIAGLEIVIRGLAQLALVADGKALRDDYRAALKQLQSTLGPMERERAQRGLSLTGEHWERWTNNHMTLQSEIGSYDE